MRVIDRENAMGVHLAMIVVAHQDKARVLYCYSANHGVFGFGFVVDERDCSNGK